MKRQLSVVIPIYNEVDNIAPLYKAIAKAIDAEFPKSQFIFVDDGSSDGSLKKLIALSKKDSRVEIVELRRNFGQTAALSAGFERAIHDIVITLDGDLQNDPEDISKLVKKLEAGFDLVSGWRKDRHDDATRVAFSKVANEVIGSMSGVKLHDYGCTLKAYRLDLVKQMRLYGEMHRFIPAVASQYGAKITEIPVRHHPRKHGVSKYGLDRTFRVILDIILVKFLLSFQNKPLHLFGSLGIISSLLGSGIFGYLSFEKIVHGASLSDRPLFMVSIFMIMVGIQFITIGILAEMLMRVYYESQGRKPYFIRQVHSKKK